MVARDKSAHSVYVKVHEYLETLTLDKVGEARAAIALSLALALDASREASSGAVAQAIPSMAKELRATLMEIQNTKDEGDEFIEDLFA
jgi:hypothetical protein